MTKRSSLVISFVLISLIINLQYASGEAKAKVNNGSAAEFLNETAPEIFDWCGTSFFDFNAYHRNPRQIAVPGWVLGPWVWNPSVAVSWSRAPFDLTKREWYSTLWIGASKHPGNVLKEWIITYDTGGTGGFGGTSFLPWGGNFILYFHQERPFWQSYYQETWPSGTYFAVEKTPQAFDWDDIVPVPDSIAGEPRFGGFPSAGGGFHVNGTDTAHVIHFLMYHGGEDIADIGKSVNKYSYSRMLCQDLYPYTWESPGFSDGLALLVDSGVFISPTVITSKKSQRVALVYTSEYGCSFSNPPINCSDVYLKESFVGGQDWIDVGSFGSFPSLNISNYQTNERTRANGDLMGVYDENDSLVIAWVENADWSPLTGQSSALSNIMVWTREHGKRKAVDGNFTQMPGVKVPDSQYRRTLNWPHIAVHIGVFNPSRQNYYYLTYTQYGGNDAICYSDTSIGGLLNGEVYISVSTDRGKTWSSGRNATNSRAPCLWDCSGVAYSSAAERCTDTIHIAFMSDLHPVTAINDSNPNNLTNNTIHYMKYPAFDPSVDTLIAVSQAYFRINPLSVVTDTFYVQNFGNTDLTISSISKILGVPWLTINNGTGGFQVPEGNSDVPIEFVTDGTQLIGSQEAIFIYNNSENNPSLKILITVGQAPVLDSISNLAVNEGSTLNVNIHALDADFDRVSLFGFNLPPNSSFVDSGNGKSSFQFNPDTTQAGVYSIQFVASDGFFSDSQLVEVSVSNCVIPGDATDDSKLSLSDVIATINYIFNKPGYPACQASSAFCWLHELLCRGDWNGGDGVSLADVIQGVNYIFNKPGGPWNPVPSGVCCLPVP